MAETNGQQGFGELSRNSAKLEEYESGSWIRFFEKGNVYHGKIEEVDHKNGEVTFTALTQFVNNEKGYILAVVEVPEKFMLADIQRHRLSNQIEIDEAIKNQSPFYSRIGEYVALPCGGTTYTGKLHKMFRNHVELLPCINIRRGEHYIEKEKPICVPVSSGSIIMPRTKEDLDYIVAESIGRKNKECAPSQESKIIIAT